MDLNEVATFVRVVDAGGFSAAAEELGLPKSTVSRRVSRLEQRLGVRLLERTTRRMRLTEAGQSYYDQVSGPVTTLRLASNAAEEKQDEPQGVLRLTAPLEFGDLLGRLLAGFARAYPEIHAQVELTGRMVDLIREGFDVALRVGELADSSLVARRVGEVELQAFASPSYLEEKGLPEAPRDLREHDCVLFRSPGGTTQWELTSSDGTTETVEVSGALGGDDFAFVRAATVSSGGVGLIPAFAAERDVEDKKLVRVLKDWRSRRSGLHIVYPSARFLPAKVRAFRDHLIENF
ncbi:MAG: LysR family transcriptional regulator [Myxococcota bacterium]